MLLTARDGARFEVHLVGYQSPTQVDNWLLVAIAVTTPQGHGGSVEPCLETREVRRMITWFNAVADGVPVHPWGGGGLEVNLEFWVTATSPQLITLRADFILESGAWYPADGKPAVSDYHGSLTFELTRDDLRQLADEFAGELAGYPPRSPERPLPSPLL